MALSDLSLRLPVCGSSLFMQMIEALLAMQPRVVVQRAPRYEPLLIAELDHMPTHVILVERGHAAGSTLWLLMQSGAPLVALDVSLERAIVVQQRQETMHDLSDRLELLPAYPRKPEPGQIK